MQLVQERKCLFRKYNLYYGGNDPIAISASNDSNKSPLMQYNVTSNIAANILKFSNVPTITIHLIS